MKNKWIVIVRNDVLSWVGDTETETAEEAAEQFIHEARISDDAIAYVFDPADATRFRVRARASTVETLP